LNGTLTYKIPVSAQVVGVRLHFAEMYWGRPGGGVCGETCVGKRLFDISVEGQIFQENFDIYQSAQGPATAIVVPIDRVEVGSNGTLDLQFTAHADNVSIAGIEVLEAQ